MKKSLIASGCVVAASAVAASAQVTITGNYTFGYKTSTQAPNQGSAATTNAFKTVTQSLGWW